VKIEKEIPISTRIFSTMSHASLAKRILMMIGVGIFLAQMSYGAESSSPELVLRAIVQANAEKDLATMERHFSHDPHLLGYGIGGTKYVGWDELARDIRSEFKSTNRLEIPILDLRVWTKGDVAWFVIELDYIRHSPVGLLNDRLTQNLRETGVLERRDGQWIVVSWHSSPRYQGSMIDIIPRTPANVDRQVSRNESIETTRSYDLSGEWEVVEIEENRTYRATLDKNGNGPYTWQGGHYTTTSFQDGRWQGTWTQTGNDREGGFELVLSEDGTQAKGIWWYTRVGTRHNIPPRQHGGSYLWKRMTTMAPTRQ
jgi:hypothetical protein